MNGNLKRIMAIVLSCLCLGNCMAFAEDNQEVDIQILATSDLHGMFYPWNYSQDKENTKGSMVQLATAVKALRTENTLVLDAGDAIQDNCAEIFLNDEIHPMVKAMNLIGYDAVTTGNHEYNYGMDVLKNIISQHQAKVLVGNVWDKDGKPLGEPYAIFERGGVRIGVIGMVTPNILRWDMINLKGCTVTDPVVETRKIIDEIGGQVDVLVSIMHMGLENELGVPNSGVRDLTKACPEFAVVVASHDHQSIVTDVINDVMVVENINQAQTMSVIHVKLDKTAEGISVRDVTAENINIAEYEADPVLLEELKEPHEKAVAYSHTVIGELKGGNLAPVNEIDGIPQALLEDTAMIELINKVALYYSGAKVSGIALLDSKAGLKEGTIRRCDISLLYKFSNTLYTLTMTGKQLKTWMEWTANYYQQYQDGHLTVAFNPNMRTYLYDMFEGVCYKIDISKPVGERIIDLTWPDGTPVQDDEEFLVATSNYRAASNLLVPGEVYSDGDLPKLVESDVHGSDIGGIREMISKYIQDVCGGVITPEVNHNWKLIGNNWDEALHQKAVQQINGGLIQLTNSDNGRYINIKPITKEDLK